MSLAKAIEQFRRDKRTERNRLIAAFCGVSYDSASRWSVKRLPEGESLNKLWYLLAAYGIEVPELAKLPPAVRYLGQLVAHDVLSTEEAKAELQLSTNNFQHLWRVLQGRSTPVSVKKNQLTVEGLMKKYGESLEAAVNRKVEEGTLPLPAKREPRALPILKDPVVGDSYITIAAAFVSGLEPLLKRIDAEGDTAVNAFRSSVDQDIFHDVLDLLKAMSSRKAREYYRGTGK